MTTNPLFSRLHPRLQHAIARRLGWQSLRFVQELAGHAILDGHNAVILAPTAGGKTEASFFPALSNLCATPPTSCAILYIAPIKALLNNQATRLDLYTSMIGLRRFVWHGDVSQTARKHFLHDPAEVLMTTPESLEVMLMSSKISVRQLFHDLRFVIIDEVHALAGQDRGAHLLSVLERIAEHSAHDLQRIGLSATVGNPHAILDWLTGSSRRQGAVVDPPHAPAKKSLLVTLHADEHALANASSKLANQKKSLLFCQSRSTSEAVASAMQETSSTQVFVHHSSVSAEERERAEATFASSSSHTAACIVCTSTLELGIDIGDLDLVLQVDAPSTVGAMLQRMGRTGRRPNTIANITFLCLTPDAATQAWALLDLARSGWVEDVRINRRCWPVLAHQLMAMALATGGLRPDIARSILLRVTDFQDISGAEFDALIAHMVALDYLFDAGGLLVVGQAGEQAFGRRNFMEMYAVFSSPLLFQVETLTGRALGSLEQAFVDHLLEQSGSTFVLAGRRWQVEDVNLRERRLRVSRASSGKNPSWGGWVPQHLGFELCQRIKALLCDDPSSPLPPFIHASARHDLDAARQEFAAIFAHHDGLIIEDDEEIGEITWWTFAGGKVNHTLRALLETDGWHVVHDNFKLRLSRAHDAETPSLAWAESWRMLHDPTTWQLDAPHWDTIASALPSYRLSKFQRMLPAWAVKEMMVDFLLDIERARHDLLGLP